MIGHWKILKNFWKDKKVGAVVSTSPICVRKVCQRVDYSKDNVIVEYGPGTGVFTDYLLDKSSENSKLILIETNENLVQDLENKYKDDKRVEIYHDSAENVGKILQDSGEKKADYVVSGIPFSFFGKKLKMKIIKNTRDNLARDGKFLIYQYNTHITRYLENYFDNVETEFTIWNLPPITIFEVTMDHNQKNGKEAAKEKESSKVKSES
jgi:phospholipid N-methyltransferase